MGGEMRNEPSDLDIAVFALGDARYVLEKIARTARQNRIANLAYDCIARIDAQVKTETPAPQRDALRAYVAALAEDPEFRCSIGSFAEWRKP